MGELLAAGSERFLLAGLVCFILGLAVGVATSGGFRSWRSRISEGGRLAESSAVFKGINYILANEPDMAIEEFTKAVKINSNTIETYVALGNLFRSKGEIERAIRIRQTIILRPQVDAKTKIQALFDMGLDYRKGGLIERAIASFEEVIKSDPGRIEAYVQVESLYEEIKDWENAYAIQARISKLRRTPDRSVLAHLQAEIGKMRLEEGDGRAARKAFDKAIQLDGGCIDAHLHLGDLHFKEGRFSEALACWKTIAEIDPAMTFLACRRLEGAYGDFKDLGMVEDFLRHCARKRPDVFTHVALARYLARRNLVGEAIGELRKALEIEPKALAARKAMGELLMASGRTEEALAEYSDLLANLDTANKDFQCRRCGFETADILWRCPGCLSWDTITRKPGPEGAQA